MTRKNPPARWVLPDVVDPAARKCIQIQVPDDPAHIAAFRGALLALASGYNWSDDPTHKAKDVAKVWRDILDNTFDWGCEGMQTKLRVDDICTLSWSYDDWVTFDSYDPSGCILANIDSVVPGMINQAIIDAIRDGTLQGGSGQQGPQPQPEPGQCRTYHVRLTANTQWHCPSPVSTGDVITITNATGMYWDGDLLNFWKCPNGQDALLGVCTGGQAAEAGDPLQTADHMKVVGHIGSTWFDAMAAPYTVAAGVNNLDFFVQANDSNLADNQGEVTFDVQVCSASATWEHVFDFTTGQHGWSFVAGTHTWYGNIGGGYFGAPDSFGIQMTIPSGAYEVTMKELAYYSDQYYRDGLRMQMTGTGCVDDRTAGSHHITFSPEACYTDGNILSLQGYNEGGIAIKTLTLSGHGAFDPFEGM